MSAADKIRAMIETVRTWRIEHKTAKPPRPIDAAACDIRERALMDALKVIEP